MSWSYVLYWGVQFLREEEALEYFNRGWNERKEMIPHNEIVLVNIFMNYLGAEDCDMVEKGFYNIRPSWNQRKVRS